MTIIKQKAVSSERHLRNLRDYIDKKPALLRGWQNVMDSRGWFREMAAVREAAGHDVPAREGAKNTVMYHQILAFLADECDVNGGPMTPKRCMEYAREYASKRYPEYMVTFALHKEKSPHVEPKEAARAAVKDALSLGEAEMSHVDKALSRVYLVYEAKGKPPRRQALIKELEREQSMVAHRIAKGIEGMGHDPCGEGHDERYAVHMAINRTNLVTGNRLNEGRGAKAKRDRAQAVRDMDEFWGLRQVERGKQNSKVHPRQPSVGRVEKAIEERGGHSYKSDLRLLCQSAAMQAHGVGEYVGLLQDWGADVEEQNGRIYVSDAEHPAEKTGEPFRFEVGRLDRRLAMDVLLTVLKANEIRDAVEQINRVAEEKVAYRDRKAEYGQAAKAAFERYRKEAVAARGVDFKSFPKLALPKIPASLAKDTDVQRMCLSYKRQSEAMRRKLASGVPVGVKAGGGTSGGKTKARGHEEPGRSRNRGIEH